MQFNGECLHSVANLLLDIPCGYIHLLQRAFQALRFPLGRMKSVLLFKFSCDSLATMEIVPLVQTFSVLVHTDRDDVQMVSVNILVLIDHIGLVAVTEFLQIFACDILKIGVGQPVIWMRIEGDMDNGLLRSHCRWHIP